MLDIWPPFIRRRAARAVAWTTAAAAFVAAWYAIGVLELASWDAGARRAGVSCILLVSASIASLLAARRGATSRRPPRPLSWLALVLVAALAAPGLWQQVTLFRAHLAAPHLNDIPLTTLAASRAIGRGENPYRVAVDPRAESQAQHRNFDGFKYMPLMAVLYAPAAALDSERAVLVTNMVLNVVTALLVLLIARTMADPMLACWGAILYLSPTIVPRQLFGPGVTDLAAVVPLLAAFWCAERRPGLSGVLVGVSLSMKLVPALAVAPVIAPAIGTWRTRNGLWFWTGLLVGFLPVLIYFAWSPADFASNVFLFNLARPVDSTSWMSGHPDSWRLAAAILLAFTIVIATIWRWCRPTSPRTRLVAIYVLSVLLTLLGPLNHGNYQLWWIPWLAITLGVTASDALRGRRESPA